MPDDLEAILSLMAQDSMHYYDGPDAVTDNQRAALDEIIADAHQDLLVSGSASSAATSA